MFPSRHSASYRFSGFEMNWGRAWMIACAALLIISAIFLWRNNLSVAFVTAALGACAWFLSYRAKIQKEIAQVRTGSGSDRLDNDDAQDED